MPRKNGTGSCGQSAAQRRNLCRGHNKRMDKVDVQIFGRGPGGNCLCPECAYKVEHLPGVPCTSMACPQCGCKMLRE